MVDCFGYDAYGVMLGGNPNHSAPAATSLLYAGEHFDTDSQNYYLRARWYDSLSGRFNRMDPFAGNKQDPQSLHKYLYCHANPVNNIDPSGLFSFGEMLCVATLVACLSALVAGTIGYYKGYSAQKIEDLQWKWFWRGFVVGAIAYGAVWAIHSLWLLIFGGGSAGVITAQQSAETGFGSHRELVEAWQAQGATDPIHHFVQQTSTNISNFGLNAIYSLKNSIPLARNLHIELHRFTQSSTTTLGLSDLTGGHYSNLWQFLQTLPWEIQYRWGVAMLNYVLQNQSMQGFDPVSQGLL